MFKIIHPLDQIKDFFLITLNLSNVNIIFFEVNVDKQLLKKFKLFYPNIDFLVGEKRTIDTYSY